MKILSFYVMREFLFTFPLSFLVFSFIFFIGKIPQLIDIVVVGGDVLFRLLIYIFIFSIPYSLPIAMLTAILMVAARLSGDNELLAATASGMRIWQPFILILIVSFLLSLFLLYFGNNISPLARYRFEKTIYTLTEKPQSLLRERVFIDEFSGHRFFIGHVEGEELWRVYVWQLHENKFPITIFARRGRVIFDEEKMTLLLFDGVKERILTADFSNYHHSTFKEYQFSVLLPRTIDRGKGMEEMTLQELRDEIKALRGVGVCVFLTEIHERAALAFTPLIFVLIGMPLGVFIKKGSRSVGFGLSVLVVIAYYIMMMFFRMLGEGGVLPIVVASWLPGGLLATTGIFLIKGK